MSISSSVWKRTGVSEISRNAYIRLVCLFTLLVAATTAIGALVSYHWPFSWPLLIGTFIGALACIILFELAGNPFLSAIGVNGMGFLLGLMMGPAVAQYTGFVVLEALVSTASIMAVMSIVGILVPQLFRGLGAYLLAGLTVLIFAQFAQLIFLSLGFRSAANLPLLDWLGVSIFTLYVAYDWSKALDVPYTVDNAIDVSGALILDAINLFLRLLAIFGRSSSSSND